MAIKFTKDEVLFNLTTQITLHENAIEKIKRLRTARESEKIMASADHKKSIACIKQAIVFIRDSKEEF
jgi:hypothetical protein